LTPLTWIVGMALTLSRKPAFHRRVAETLRKQTFAADLRR
jgi:hypothetical protein